jgi:hypothetical protein
VESYATVITLLKPELVKAELIAANILVSVVVNPSYSTLEMTAVAEPSVISKEYVSEAAAVAAGAKAIVTSVAANVGDVAVVEAVRPTEVSSNNLLVTLPVPD